MWGGRGRIIGTVAVAGALVAPAAAGATTFDVAPAHTGCGNLAQALQCQTVAQARALASNNDAITVHGGSTYAATSVDFGALAGITLQGAGDGVARLEGPADSTVLTFNHSFTLRNIAVIASGTTGTALFALSKNNESDAKAVALDDVILGGATGASGTGFLARTLTPGLIDSAPGDITVTADHVTIAGAPRAIRAEAQAAGNLLSGPIGRITVNASGSIVHGTLTFSDCGCGALNTPTLNVPGSSNELDSAPGGTFFQDAGAGRDYRLRVDAPTTGAHAVRDTGPAPPAQPPTDVEGDARVLASTSPGTAVADRGADEIKNLPPSTPTVGSSPASPHTGDVVTLSATGSIDPEAAIGGGITAYAWNFGDGQPTVLTPTASTTHTYNSVGSFVVTVQAVDAQGFASGGGTTTVTTVNRPPPAVTIGAAPTSAVTGQSVDFSTPPSNDPDAGDSVSYVWTFGDGQTATTTSPATSHAYHSIGTYQATVKAIDTHGGESAVSGPIAIDVPNRPPLTPSLSSSDANPDLAVPVKLTANGAADPDEGDAVTSYVWTFGDGTGTTTTAPTVAHAYSSEGDPVATVKVIDRNNATSGTATLPLHVRARPKAALTVSDLHPRQRASVRFDASASRFAGDRIASFRFDFGDGTVETSYQGIALHAYANSGRYSASVTFTTAGGLTSPPATADIQVRDGVAPVVSIGSPRQGQRFKKVPPSVLTLSGRAADATGLRRVEIALRYVSPAGGAANACRWFNGKRLVKGSCVKPVWLRAKLLDTRWTYAVRKPRSLPRGFYELRVRGTDVDDNISNVFSVPRKTILIFRLG
jgi:PKD repeat protein